MPSAPRSRRASVPGHGCSAPGKKCPARERRRVAPGKPGGTTARLAAALRTGGTPACRWAMEPAARPAPAHSAPRAPTGRPRLQGTTKQSDEKWRPVGRVGNRWQALDSSTEQRVQGDPRRPGGLLHKTRYAQPKPDFDKGSDRTLLPVALKIALATAGRIGGRAWSPNPVGSQLVLRQWN